MKSNSSTVNEDLNGGYFDGGDYVKFNFPAAAATIVSMGNDRVQWGIQICRRILQWPGVNQMGNRLFYPMSYR